MRDSSLPWVVNVQMCVDPIHYTGIKNSYVVQDSENCTHLCYYLSAAVSRYAVAVQEAVIGYHSVSFSILY